MKDYLSNKAEEAIIAFLDKLDSEVAIGPAPLSGYKFEDITVDNMLDCDPEVALKLFSEPSELLYDEQDQVYVNIEVGDGAEVSESRLYLDSDTRSAHYASMCHDVIVKLPAIGFDIECGGYPTRQSEAAAIYKVAVVNAFHEKEYQKEVDDILTSYDFSRMSSASGGTPFTILLKKIQEEADSITKVVLTCCTTKLVADSVKKDTSFKGWLKEDDSEKLRLAAEKDSTINYKYNDRFKDASSAKEKILLGEEYAQERKELINSLEPEMAILFSVYKMDMNVIPGRAKRKIRNAANEYVWELIEQGTLDNDRDVVNEFKKKLIRRAQKNFLSRMKVIRYKMWNDGIRENLIPKS
jgi:hypothetical protein